MAIASGAEMLASDMNNLIMLPKGTILMFDGGGWADNQTLPGWYKCNGQFVNGEQIPNLIDRFLRGATVSGQTGGSTAEQTITLTTTNMPSHYHSIRDAQHNHTVSLGSRHGAHSSANSSAWDNGDVIDGSTVAAMLITHKSGLATRTDNVGATSPASFAVSAMPSYYTVIYIIKMV
jgi:hypothetical protein